MNITKENNVNTDAKVYSRKSEESRLIEDLAMR